MRVRVVCVLFYIHCAYAQVLYDAYFGTPLKNERSTFLNFINATSSCVIRVKPCNQHEGRRVDGTCANPKYPSRGGNTLRTSLNGSDLPSTRLLRTKLLSDGHPTDHNFNNLASHFGVFATIDNIDLTGILRYTPVSDCCVGNTPNRVNPQCISIPVAADDPYLRRTGVRCMNLTRMPTFQERGCISNAIPAERYNLVTPLLDLSVVYGFTNERERQIREYKDGLLISEKRNVAEYPPGTARDCIGNKRPIENICYEFGDTMGGNINSGVTLVTLWFFREHNRLAHKLAEINPCWTDQQLFETARYINIAEWQHLFYYELMADLLGRENAMRTGIIYDTQGYVNDFDENYEPGVYHEYIVGSRWFHTFQDGRSDLYSSRGYYLGSRTAVDDALRSGILELNNTEADLTQGAFRQPSHKFDYVIDPDMAERIAGELHTALDLSAVDIARGRDQGLQPYNQYRKLCGLPYAHKFEDFHDVIFPDKVEQMRRIYYDVNDVDLMAAIYSEKLIDGGFVGPTLFCIIVQNMLQWRRNEIRSCKAIPSMDLTKWTDERCSHKDNKQNDYEKEHMQYSSSPYESWES
ncbi:unnamed protein product [Diatraea saccharalis]|uniref:Peroxidase n=1 Tax=Diatraea saccharalis TaxID=40085 RepID=A0A9N9RGU7_9NEOP|nr:unnamed protein product [Diatraea saccharalis]